MNTIEKKLLRSLNWQRPQDWEQCCWCNHACDHFYAKHHLGCEVHGGRVLADTQRPRR